MGFKRKRTNKKKGKGTKKYRGGMLGLFGPKANAQPVAIGSNPPKVDASSDAKADAKTKFETFKTAFEKLI
jgi:hypothetical protein